MTTTAYQPTLTGAAAREHVNDLLREAAASRAAAELLRQDRHRTPRRRALWWLRVTARSATPRQSPAPRPSQARKERPAMKQQQIVKRITRNVEIALDLRSPSGRPLPY